MLFKITANDGLAEELSCNAEGGDMADALVLSDSGTELITDALSGRDEGKVTITIEAA